MKREIALGGAVHPVTLMRRGDAATVDVAGRAHRCSLASCGEGEHLLRMDGKTWRVWIATHRNRVWVHAFGRAFELEVLDPLDRAARASGAGDCTVAAPMPGAVVSVGAMEGERVRKGQSLMVIESMKMQTEIAAPRDGIVESVAVKAGASFDRGATLLTLKAGD
ncbi:MAG TPA: biotin/lipoyl-containing protein [Burkholderiaceae bacterium]|jgi:biotin carboxyl carrier protein|nr:biotin/lipoyl-containing protein [Burkholderiaceae bacterium]